MPFTYSKGDLDAQPWYAGYASASSDIPERYTDFTAPTDAQAQLAASIIEGFSSYQQGMWVQPGLFNGSSITFFSYNDRPGFQATGAINLGSETRAGTVGKIWIGIENDTYAQDRATIAGRLFHELLHSNTRIDAEATRIMNNSFSEYTGY